MLVGKIVGKTSPEMFYFEVSDVIRKMDFVATRDPERHLVLGRVEGIMQERDRAIAKVSVIGFIDNRDVVQKPRMPFKPGSLVYSADDGLIKKVLGLKSSGFYIGLLENSENLKIYLDPKKIITKHLAVLAKTGMGKSYFIGVLLEEFIENKIPAVVIDPHGEYMSLMKPNSKKEEIKYMDKYGIEPKGYKNEIEVYSLEKNLSQGTKRLTLDGRLTPIEIFEMLPFKLTPSQLSIIYSVVRETETKKRFTLEDLKRDILRSNSKSKWNVITVIDYLIGTKLFDPIKYIKPSDLVKRDKLTIINLKGVEPDIQQLVVYKIVRDLFEARKHDKIPPFLLVVEEAHNFCPERGFGGQAISSQILRTIASEGRKFGMGLAVVSQRPARVEKNVLSQCNTQVFLRITNPNDIKTIMESVEGITKGIENELKALPIGTALIVGVIEQPLLVDIRIKRSDHGGAAMVGEKKTKSEDSDTLFYFPKFLEDDVKGSVKRLEQFKLIYYPIWKLICKFKLKGEEKIDDLFIDGITGELVYLKNDMINRTSGLPEIVELKVKEKVVLLYLNSYGNSTFEEMVEKLKIGRTELQKILSILEEKDMIKEENKTYKSLIKINFEEIVKSPLKKDTVTYKHSGELVPFKMNEGYVNRVLSLFSPDAVERKKLYYPYWLIFYDDGKVDVVDALTGERDDFLSEGSFQDFGFE
ncbi:MAG: ATP-binding protein [Candidatus Aenigmatarchaeota archaeon]